MKQKKTTRQTNDISKYEQDAEKFKLALKQTRTSDKNLLTDGNSKTNREISDLEKTCRSNFRISASPTRIPWNSRSMPNQRDKHSPITETLKQEDHILNNLKNNTRTLETNNTATILQFRTSEIEREPTSRHHIDQ